MNDHFRRSVVCAALLALPCVVSAQEDHSAHAGHVDKQARVIKALSHDEIAELLAGAGAGLALAAELNRYPGPKHALELKGKLGLTAEQTARITEIFVAMKAQAMKLGAELVEAERELDAAFAQRTITDAMLAESMRRIGRLQGELRQVHLQAHLATTPLLTPAQRSAYDHERGYTANP